MSNLLNNIQLTLTGDEMFGSLDFAKFMAHVDVRLITPIDDAHAAYRSALKEISEGAYVSRVHEKFIHTGLDYINTALERNNQRFYMSSHTVRMLKEILIELKLTEFIPDSMRDIETYSQENGYGAAQSFTVMWKWDTLTIGDMSTSDWMGVSKLLVEYEQSIREDRVADAKVQYSVSGETSVQQFGESVASPLATQLKNLNLKLKTQPLFDKVLSRPKQPPVVTEPASVGTTAVNAEPAPVEDYVVQPEPEVNESVDDAVHSELEFQQLLKKERSESVKFSMMVAKRYLDKARNAAQRGIEFTLTLDDFSALMRGHICYYTHQPLITEMSAEDFKHRRIPDNYLSIERVDSNKGYTRDNTVVCGHAINVAKQSSTAAEFKQMLSLAQLMAGLSEDQRKILSRLGALN